MQENRLDEKLLGSKEEDLKTRIWIESKKLWRVAAPAMLTRVSSFGMFVLTQAFIGHVGETQLAAYALLLTLLMRFANGILLGMGSALETFCGQAYGARQYHMLGIYMQRSWIILLITAVVILPLFIFATPILKLLGQEAVIADAAGNMALWFIPMNFYFVFTFTFQMFLQAQMKNHIIGWLAVISFAVLILLSWITVYKLNLGVAGAMGSLVTSCWLTIVGQFIYVLGGWCSETWPGFSKSAFSELWPVAKLSLSSGVMLCLEFWYNSVLILLVGRLKNATIAISAFSICLNIIAGEFMLALGFTTAASVRVANELGRGDAKATKFAIKVVASTSLIIGVVFFALFLSLGNVISYAFTNSVEVAEEVSSLKVYLAFSVLLNSIQPVLTGVALGAGWQVIVAYVNIGCYYIIGIPAGVLLGFLTSLQVKGIWIGMMCGVAAQTLVLICITKKTDWNHQVEKATSRLNEWILPKTNEPTENRPNP